MDWSDILKLLPLLGIPSLIGAWVWGLLGAAVPPAPLVGRAIRHRCALALRGGRVAPMAEGRSRPSSSAVLTATMRGRVRCGCCAARSTRTTTRCCT